MAQMNLDRTFVTTTTRFFHDVYEITKSLYTQGRLGLEAVDKTDLGKRQLLLEAEIFQHAKHLVEHSFLAQGYSFVLEVEGYETVNSLGESGTIYIDPVDGTANLARSAECNLLQSCDAAVVVSIRKKSSMPTFGDVVLGGAMDLRDGTIWIAADGFGVQRASANFPNMFFEERRHPVYNRHNPFLAAEFYRQASWAMRLLINQTIEWSDRASSFLNMLQVPLGRADCFINNLLPSVFDEGQRGYELGAIMPFVKGLGAYAVDMRTRRSLEESLFTFNGMTPVMIGVDEETVDYYLAMIDENLRRTATMRHVVFTVEELIRVVHKEVGTRRWSLRSLPEPSAS